MVAPAALALAPSLLELLAKAVDTSRPEWKKNEQDLRRRLTTQVKQAAAEHHGYVVSWCQEVHSRVLASPIEAASPSIELRLRQVPRRLGFGGKELGELDLLLDREHVALLGDLGAGKTTTLRRLAREVALEPPFSDEDYWKLATVVVCRDQHWDDNHLYDVLGRAVGVTGRLAADLDNPEATIRKVLDVGRLILVDGLDEVPPRFRAHLERELVELARHLQRSKIVLSCRSADYVAALEGFATAEIQPLIDDEIRQLIEGLLGATEAGEFTEALAASPTRDLAGRPLFLIYLAALYMRRGTLPDRPSALYEGIVRLAIQDWDEQRGVVRASKWAGFGVDEKRRFLADLALELTRRELVRFEDRTLAEVYQLLARRHGLPSGEGDRVARELEAHTGLIAQVSGSFEFAHLGLQEYLAADALVRGGAKERATWWMTSAEVAAVTVALSSDPNSAVHEIIDALPPNIENISPLTVFLDRLGQERPSFIADAQLGYDLLRLCMSAHLATEVPVRRLGGVKAVRDSVAKALASYGGFDKTPGTLRAAGAADRSASSPPSLRLPTPVVEGLVGGAERLHQIVVERERDTGS
jgi:hypothetical protein